MKKTILIIRDGWGQSEETYGNAIATANVPNHLRYLSKYPTAVLACTGRDVGNPEGIQGGSEVGHLTLGAGRIVWQPQELINRTIEDESILKNTVLLQVLTKCQKNKSSLHLSGLFSEAGVHSDVRQLYPIIKMAADFGVRVYLHLVLDGRDVGERSALDIFRKFDNEAHGYGDIRYASVCGRFYAMDRDTNWERTKATDDLWFSGKGYKASNPIEAIEAAYNRGDKTDYYVQPTILVDDNDMAFGVIKENDAFLWFNFRTDRSRQVVAMVANLPFCPLGFQREVRPEVICMCRYDEKWQLPVMFEQAKVANNLGEVLSKAGKTQLRIAETEKYAHVTFFFNSQQEKVNPGEERVLIPSPKVPSYDEKPEMSAYEITEELLPRIGKHDFILVNFANPDLVGHSGVFDAVVKACEVVDECVGKIVEKAIENDYWVILGADHGNAEHMLNPDGSVDASHGFNPVTYTLIGNYVDQIKMRGVGGLKDVAPTILELIGIIKPTEMTGESLIIHK